MTVRLLLIPVLIVVFSLGLAAQSLQIETSDGAMTSGALVGFYREGLRYDRGGAQIDLPWSSIINLRSAEEVLMALGEDERIKVRVVGVRDGRLLVESALLGAMRVDTAGLPSAPAPAPAPDPEAGPLKPKDWNGHVAFNIGLTAGNSDTLLAALDALLRTQSSRNRYEIRLNAVYGESDGVENANAQSLRGALEHHYSESLYSFARVEAFRDKIQSIDLGALLDLGVGWVVWRHSDDEYFALEAGIGYRHESYSDDTDPRNDITARGAVVYETIYFDKVDFRFTAEMIVPMNEPNAWLGRAGINWSIPVSDHWAFDNAIRFQYRNEPAGNSENYDLFVGAGLKYSF